MSGVRSSKRHKNRRQAPAPAIDAIVEITTLGSKGDGLASYHQKVIHIPYTAPGDEIEARIFGERASVTRLLQSSPYRQSALCHHYGDCGGCSLQHIKSDYRRQWQIDRVKTALLREGVIDVPISPSPTLPGNTRRRATFSVAGDKTGKAIGFKARLTHRVVALEECHILDPELFAMRTALATLCDFLPASWQTLPIQINKCDNGYDVNLLGEGDILDLPAKLFESLSAWLLKTKIIRVSVGGEVIVQLHLPSVNFDGIEVNAPPGAFLQASAEGQASLLERVREILTGQDIKPGAVIADLFCGCGAFALPLSREYAVYAADNHGGATAAMVVANRQNNQLREIEVEARDLFKQPLLPDELSRFDAVIFDPPRAGAPAQVKQLASTSVPLVIGVSCNPSSFARDARLLAKGGYTLTQVHLVDQFTWSPHIELVGTFIKTEI